MTMAPLFLVFIAFDYVQCLHQRSAGLPTKTKSRPSFPCDPWTDEAARSTYCKPALLVLGCQKCGSSSLYHAMMEHPNFRYSGPKELLYWNGGSKPGTDTKKDIVDSCSQKSTVDYLMNFKDIKLRSATNNGQWGSNQGLTAFSSNGIHSVEYLTGEFSATYFECYCCARTLKTILPQAKMVVLLRDPMSRAWSRYREQKLIGNTALHNTSFYSYYEDRLPKLRKCLNSAGSSTILRAKCAAEDNVLGWSMHDVFLKNWMDEGYSRKNLQILYLDDWSKEPAAQMRKVEEFAHLPTHDYGHVLKEKYNVHNGQGLYGWDTEKVGRKLYLKDSRRQRVTNDLANLYLESLSNLRELCRQMGWQEPPASWEQTVQSPCELPMKVQKLMGGTPCSPPKDSLRLVA